MAMTDYQRIALLDRVTAGAGVADSPTTLYVGASTTLPTITGTNVTEPVGNAYARKAISTWDVGAAVGATADVGNTNEILFAEASGSWGTLIHGVLYDALTGGNLLGWGSIGSISIDSGDQLRFQADNIKITMT